VDALQTAGCVGRIVAVGDVASEGLQDIIEPEGDLVSNIKKGIDALDASGHVLMVSSDIPLLTAEAVEDFIKRAVPFEADMAYPILRRADCEARYPEMKRTYVKTADGVFTGGNMMLLSTRFIEEHYDAIAGAYAARKQPLKLARMIGVGILLRVMMAQVIPAAVSVAALDRRVSKMFGAKVAAVISQFPEIGEDVDKPSDVAAVEQIMAGSRGS